VATIESYEVMLPVKTSSTTAVAFHAVDVPHGVGMDPRGDLVSGGSIGTKLADIFAGGGDVQYYLMDADGNDVSPGTAGLDVGAAPGSVVLSPVDGRVTAVRSYEVQGEHQDCEIDVQLNDPSLQLLITHIVPSPDLNVGDRVAAGYTLLGRVREFPDSIKQGIAQYTNDAGDHVQMIAVRVQADIAGF
jgi:hypothetical protein